MRFESTPELGEQLRFQVATALIRSGIKLLPTIQSSKINRTELVLTTFLRTSRRKTGVPVFLPDLQEAVIREAKTNKEVETDALKFIIKPLFEATDVKKQLGNSDEAFNLAVEMTLNLIDTTRPQETLTPLRSVKSRLRRLVEQWGGRTQKD